MQAEHHSTTLRNMSEITINFTAPTAPVSFYAVRRFTGVDAEIALVYAEQTSVSESTLVSQTAALETGTFTGVTTKTMPALTSSVYWSEAFARTQPPVLLLTAQNNSATQGIVADTELITSQDLTRITDSNATTDFKAALTNYGLVRVTSLAVLTLQLTVGYVGSSYLNAAPPLVAATANWQTSNPCAIPLYDGLGPFSSTNYSVTTSLSSWTAPRPDCVNIAFNGIVTLFVELLPWNSGYDHYAYRLTAPAPASSSSADPWTTSNGLNIIPANGINHPHAVFRCNSGATVMVTFDVEIEIGLLRLNSANASFNATASITGGPGDDILEVEYGDGIVFAYGDDQLLWFCKAYGGAGKNSLYRHINTSSNSYTTSQVTPFTGDLLVYAGTNGTNLNVATSDGTNVYQYYFDGTTWQSVGQIFSTSGGIVDLLADIIVGDSTLIVAVLSSSIVCYTLSLV